MTKKRDQVELEDAIASKETAPADRPPPVAKYDFYKTNGEDHRTFFSGPSMTRQEFAADCDINTLMERYQNEDIGAIMRRSQEPVYVDFVNMPGDLMETMQALQEAETAFMTLPAVVRREFDNDPVRFVDFASDVNNLPKMREWGLAPPPPQEVVAAPVAAPPSSPAPQAPPHIQST